MTELVFKPNPNHPERGSSSETIAEWTPSYAPEAGKNDVKTATSGHSLELDNTAGAERVQLTHRTGSHVEMRPDGSVKVKSVKDRQDVTIGNQEIIVVGDYNIVVDGDCKIFSRGGSLVIQSDYGAAVNVKGELKLSADNISMKAVKKISLEAPFVDIGGRDQAPYLSLPYGIAPIFGVTVPTFSGLPLPTSAVPVPLPLVSGTGLTAIPSLLAAVAPMVTQLNKILQYRTLAAGAGLLKTIKDAKGNPLVPEVEQPDEIPLTNPRLYAGAAATQVLLRERQADSPEDVGDTETYSAHIDLCEKLGDITAAAKELRGQIFTSDEATPAAEPQPYKSFALESGTVSATMGSKTITGTNTKFSTELRAGQHLLIEGNRVQVQAVESDTSLTLVAKWDSATVSGRVAYVFMLRPFLEFFDKYTYPMTTRLGASSLTLASMMRNYIPPTFEKLEATPQTPILPPTGTVGGGTVGTMNAATGVITTERTTGQETI